MSQNLAHLRVLVDVRQQMQKIRIGFGQRVGAVERGADVSDPSVVVQFEQWEQRFHEIEADLDKQIADATDGIEIIERAIHVKGVGRLLSAKIVAMIDIERAQSVSALWKYCGYGVDSEGVHDRPKKGEKLVYNKRLKTTVYQLGTSFLKSNSPYRRVYDTAREFYDNSRPDWPKARKHLAAMRKMEKYFLAHLWIEWRKLEGLDHRPIYAVEKLGHTGYENAQEFGWPE